MENRSIISSLQSTSLFAGLSIKYLGHVLQSSQEKTFQPHTVLLHEHVAQDGVYFITNGLVRIYKTSENGKEITLSIQKPGDIFGEMEFFGSENLANAQSLGKSHVIVLRKKDFHDLLQQNPILWQRLITLITQKIHKTHEFMTDLVTHSLEYRCYKMLALLSEFSHEKTIPISQESFSLLVGATRPRVSEVLQKLQNEGKIKLSPKKIHLLS